MGFRRADQLTSELAEKTQHVFVAATWPDMGLRSADACLVKKFPDAILNEPLLLPLPYRPCHCVMHHLDGSRLFSRCAIEKIAAGR
jgi:hypothetical protein